MTLDEALAEWKSLYEKCRKGCDPRDVGDFILIAAASGQLIPLADHKLAVAEAYRKAAQIVSRAGHSLDTEILALADTDDLAALAALKARAEAAEADVARLREWSNVVSWLDNGEKTIFDWCAGGAADGGEFVRLGLRRELPDGTVLVREYTADGPWHPATLQETKP